MANVEKLSIALPSEMAAMLRQAVESGEYASTSEVIREALRDWKRLRLLRAHAGEEMRRLWEEGLASGPGGFADIEQVKIEARRRRTTRRKQRRKEK